MKRCMHCNKPVEQLTEVWDMDDDGNALSYHLCGACLKAHAAFVESEYHRILNEGAAS